MGASDVVVLVGDDVIDTLGDIDDGPEVGPWTVGDVVDVGAATSDGTVVGTSVGISPESSGPEPEPSCGVGALVVESVGALVGASVTGTAVGDTVPVGIGADVGEKEVEPGVVGAVVGENEQEAFTSTTTPCDW